MAHRQEAEQVGMGRALAEGAVIISAGILGPIAIRAAARRTGDWAIDRATGVVRTMRQEISGDLEEGPLHTVAGFAADLIEIVRERLDDRERSKG